MNWLILSLPASAFLLSLFVYLVFRSEAPSPRAPALDGDHYNADEMIAAFGISQDWV